MPQTKGKTNGSISKKVEIKKNQFGIFLERKNEDTKILCKDNIFMSKIIKLYVATKSTTSSIAIDSHWSLVDRRLAEEIISQNLGWGLPHQN